jgi:hypothetical protein
MKTLDVSLQAGEPLRAGLLRELGQRWNKWRKAFSQEHLQPLTEHGR